MLQFVPVAPCAVAGHHWKESGPVLLTPTLQIFRGISKVPSFPFTRARGQAGRGEAVFLAAFEEIRLGRRRDPAPRSGYPRTDLCPVATTSGRPALAWCDRHRGFGAEDV